MNIHPHLWREWREHRRSLGLLSLSLVVAVAALSTHVPVWMGDANPMRMPAVLALAAVVLTVGSDLFAHERTRGTDAFLMRVPGALSGAFRAKLLMFALISVGALAYGSALGLASHWLLVGAVPSSAFELPDTRDQVHGVGLLACFFAISTRVKTGVLTAPATALFLVMVGWPVWWLVNRSSEPWIPGIGYGPWLVVVGLGALCAARVTFLERHHPRRGVFLAGALALLPFVPAWACAGIEYLRSLETEPEILKVYPGQDGRHLFVIRADVPVRPDSGAYRLTALLLDLEAEGDPVVERHADRAWAPAGGLWLAYHAVGATGFPVIELLDACEQGEERVVYDGRTAAVLEGDVDSAVRDYWDERGVPELFRGAKKCFLRPAGTGLFAKLYTRDASGQQSFAWDPVTGQIVEEDALWPGEVRVGIGWLNVIVRPGRWMVRHTETWKTFDLVTLEVGAADFLQPEDHVCATFDDGAILVVRDGRHRWIDPESGAVREFEVTGPLGAPTEGHGVSSHNDLPLRSDGSSLILYRGLRADGKLGSGYALLDPATGTVRTFESVQNVSLVPAPVPGSAFLIEGKSRLVRIHLRSAERQVLLDIDTGDSAGRP